MTFVAETLILEAGLAPNSFLLDNNRSLTVPADFPLPAPWNLPSRLFRFPIEVGALQADGTRKIGLRHPGLADHPFVQHVAALIGAPVPPGGAPNESGYSDGRVVQWHHAIDLLSAGLWRELLETRHLTTDEWIIQAVDLALSCDDGRKLTVIDGRKVLRAVGAQPPLDEAELLCKVAVPPAMRTTAGKTVGWPVYLGMVTTGTQRAWARIFGHEGGWFSYDRAGFAQWTEKGRARFAARGGVAFLEAGGDQLAFAF